MKVNRRKFLKTAGVLGFGLTSLPGTGFAGERKGKEFITGIGICTDPANSPILAAAGYSYLETGVRGLLIPAEPEEAWKLKLETIKKSAVPLKACNSFLPPELKSTGLQADHAGILKFAETSFRRAEQVGIRIIVFGSAGSRNIPEGFSRDEARKQFISLCRMLGPAARKYGITVALEPLRSQECNFINTVEEGAGIVEEVDHPNFRLLADIYHMLAEGEGPESLVKNGYLIRHVHIAELEGRTVPGTHGQDFTPFFRALKAGGYKGKLSIEGIWENLEIQAPQALAILRKQIGEV